MSKCKRCGLPYRDTDLPGAHKNCDEDMETWLSDEERAAKVERIKAYEEKKHAKK